MSVGEGKEAAKPGTIPLEEAVGSQGKTTRHPWEFYDTLMDNNYVAIDTGRKTITNDFHVFFPKAYIRYRAYYRSEQPANKNLLD